MTALTPGVAQRFKQRILHGYFVRFHMTLILMAVMASGVLLSKGLLALGLRSLPLRYPVAILGSYLVFLGLVRIWITYVTIRGAGFFLGNVAGNVDSGSFGSSGSGFVESAGDSVHFGGGSSGGGGASSSWDSDSSPAIAAASSDTSSGSGSWLPSLDLDFDFGDDGWLVLLLLALLILAILGSGGYLVYAAPHILPEAAWQAVLAGTLTRVSKEHHHGWMSGVFHATVIPLAIILILAIGLAWAAHRHAPDAVRLIDVLFGPSK